MSTVSIFEETATQSCEAVPEPPARLLPPPQTRLILAKERMRCDRFGHYFSAIVLSLRPSNVSRRKQFSLLAGLLRARLRMTDEYGLLEGGRIAVILPMTDREAGQAVLRSLVQLAGQYGIAFDAEVVSYPTQPPNGFDDPAIRDTIAETRGRAADRVGPLIDRYPVWKRWFDIAAAGIGLLLTAPVIVSAAMAIRLTSPGAIFYLQDRTGQHGRTFKIIKLRTMVANADSIKPLLLELNERDGPAFKMSNDPRVTRVGKLLRRTGIDELPQLINVLKGEMAIVGPRPLPCDEQSECELWQHRRLDTKPGLTCYWQISKRRKVSFAEWMRMDLRYSSRRSPWCDAQLIVRTCLSVLLGRVGH